MASPATQPVFAGSALNAAVQETVNAQPGTRARLTYIAYSYVGGAVTGNVQVLVGDQVVLNLDVAAAGPTILVLPGDVTEFAVGLAVTVILAAGGVGVTGKLNFGVKFEPLG